MIIMFRYCIDALLEVWAYAQRWSPILPVIVTLVATIYIITELSNTPSRTSSGLTCDTYVSSTFVAVMELRS